MTIGDIWSAFQIVDHTKQNFAKIKQAFRFMQSDYFYQDDLVQALLYKRDFSKLPQSQFIDYRKYLNYYSQDIKQVDYKRADEISHVKLPYKEEINFIDHPKVQIGVKGDIKEYVISAELVQRTNRNLQDFLKDKPNTKAGSILRLASLKKKNEDRYECILQSSNYFSQVRTNLTLDYPLEEDSTKTLRILDMDEGGNLPPLEKSSLVNSIGVSGIVYYIKDGHKHFFMKLRRDSEGVFENMLSSTSGVVQLPKGQRVAELVGYAQHEMIREFAGETGIEEEELPIRVIKPLALARELPRGGKPQFFFLIEIQPIEKGKFREIFKKSKEGLDEFSDSVLANKASFFSAFSPEFSVNLIYALQYFQKQNNLPVNPIIFD